MNIDGVENGIVLDHIKAGRSMAVYKYLRLDELDCCVALIQNVKSAKMGKKDIIKIDCELDLDLDALGYIDPNITVNLVKNSELLRKKHLELPQELKNVLHCKNPRCITSTEREMDHIFSLVDKDKKTYRCVYCESTDDYDAIDS